MSSTIGQDDRLLGRSSDRPSKGAGTGILFGRNSWHFRGLQNLQAPCVEPPITESPDSAADLRPFEPTGRAAALRFPCRPCETA